MSKNNPSAVILAGTLALVLAGLACNLPGFQSSPAETAAPTLPTTVQPTPTLPPDPTALLPTETPVPDVDFEGISFSYDHALAGGVKTTVVPASSYEGAPEWDINPEFYQFELDGYLLQDRFHRPAVRVYPIASYRELIPSVTETIDDLKEFLNTCSQNPASIPFVPNWNAAQMMQSKVECLEFKNGKGVRFVTQYGQAAYPINNHDMFYTFQGLTSDEAYYVAAVLPVTHPSFPQDGNNPPNGDWDAFYDNFATYVAGIEQQLNGQPDDSFNPALNLLDDMIQSLRVK